MRLAQRQIRGFRRTFAVLAWGLCEQLQSRMSRQKLPPDRAGIGHEVRGLSERDAEVLGPHDRVDRWSRTTTRAVRAGDARDLGVDVEVRQLARPALEPSRPHAIPGPPARGARRARPAATSAAGAAARAGRRSIERVVDSRTTRPPGRSSRDARRARRPATSAVDRVEVGGVVVEARRARARARRRACGPRRAAPRERRAVDRERRRAGAASASIDVEPLGGAAREPDQRVVELRVLARAAPAGARGGRARARAGRSSFIGSSQVGSARAAT